MRTNKHRNENEYIHFNFSDKTHTRSMRLKLMEPSLLSLVASITFKPQRQLLAQIASLILPLEAPQCIHCLSLTFTSFLQDKRSLEDQIKEKKKLCKSWNRLV